MEQKSIKVGTIVYFVDDVINLESGTCFWAHQLAGKEHVVMGCDENDFYILRDDIEDREMPIYYISYIRLENGDCKIV